MTNISPELLEAVARLVEFLPPEKIRALAKRAAETHGPEGGSVLRAHVTNHAAVAAVNALLVAWQDCAASGAQIEAMLLAGEFVHTRAEAAHRVELVWTGPATTEVPTRQTEQVLLQVINAAKETLHITSFVAYKVTSVVDALNQATARGVKVHLVLELSQSEGGNVDTNSLATMRKNVPQAMLYSWFEKPDGHKASLHAKVAVADHAICLITSANLTQSALEHNMEAGVLLTGGAVPRQMADHLSVLIEQKVVRRVE